jgi:hypothetical protein
VFPLLSAKKFNVALFASGDAKSGVGSASPRLAVFWNWPKPRSAKPCQSRSWFAPPKRPMSAASIASRALIIVGARGIITIAS